MYPIWLMRITDLHQIKTVRRSHRPTRATVLGRQGFGHARGGPGACADTFERTHEAAYLIVQEAACTQMKPKLGPILNLLGLNPHFGTPANPYDQTTPRAPGGSSSGSAVAVAAGLAVAAAGSDTGGSVRVPAAFNGRAGYKSSEGRIDARNTIPLSYTLDTVGPLARTVEDCILLDAAMRGTTAHIEKPALSDLKLVVPTTLMFDDLDDAVAGAFEAHLTRLSAAGVAVREATLHEIGEAADVMAVHGTIATVEAYHYHRERVDGPLSSSKAEFWLGRTNMALGNKETAREHYAKGAEYRDTFHGQLSRQALSPQDNTMDLPLPAVPTSEQIKRFLENDAVQAATIAHREGLPRTHVLKFFRAIAKKLESEAEVAMLAQLANALGDGQMEVRTG